MLAGFARRSITPPLGCVMEGFNLVEPAAAVHDELFARAIWLHADEELAIVAMDLLFLERQEVDRLKGAIQARLGIDPVRVLINFSHTHSGPRLTRWYYSGAPDPAYLEQVEHATIDAIDAARRGSREVQLSAGMGQTDLPISRRRPDADGIAQWGPCEQEPTCRALPVALFTEADGHFVAGIFSVSCHPTINHLPVISAEYPGVAVAALNQHYDIDGFVFLQGAGGDTKPRNIAVGNDAFRDGSWDDVRDAGEAVARQVIATIDAGLAPLSPRLHVAMRELELPFSAPPERQALMEEAGPTSAGGRAAWASDMLARLDSADGFPKDVCIRLQLVQLADGLRLVGVEAELGSELGNLILAHSGPGVTFPLGYTNGVQLNLPADRQLPQGGYGVTTAWEFHWPSPLAPGIDARLLRSLKALVFMSPLQE